MENLKDYLLSERILQFTYSHRKLKIVPIFERSLFFFSNKLFVADFFFYFHFDAAATAGKYI